jgi:hypothetical protein
MIALLTCAAWAPAAQAGARASATCRTVVIPAGSKTAPTPLRARAFVAGGNQAIQINSGKPRWCALVEPVGGGYDNATVDLSSLVLVSRGTGPVSEIHGLVEKTASVGDRDGNGVSEIEVCFAKTELRTLFGNLKGASALQVMVRGALQSGGPFQGQLTIQLIAGGGALAASLAPNPLNPEATLTYFTASPGPVKITVFDLQGRRVRTLVDKSSVGAGYHDVRVDGRDGSGGKLASGVYFYRIEAAKEKTEGRFTILK